MSNCIPKCSPSVAVFVTSRQCRRTSGGGKQLGLAYDQANLLFTLVPPTFSHSRAQLVSQSSSSSPPRSALVPIATSTIWLIAVVPNLVLCMHNVEAFENTPLEYVRAEMQVSEVATPRKAAEDVVKALEGVVPDSENATTGVALEWIVGALTEASAVRDD